MKTLLATAWDMLQSSRPAVLRDVAAALLRAHYAGAELDDLMIMNATGRTGPVILPVLERFDAAGVVTCRYEDRQPEPGTPSRRHFWKLTPGGAEVVAQLLAGRRPGPQ
jgi:hypothetical protein